MAGERLDQVGKAAEKESVGTSRSGERPAYTLEELLESRRRFFQPTTADGLPKVELEEGSGHLTVVDGRVESVAYPDKTVREFTYDDEGRLRSVKQPTGSVWTLDEKTGEWRSDKGLRFIGTIEVSAGGKYSYTDKSGMRTSIHPDGHRTEMSAAAVAAEGASERLEGLKAALKMADGDQDGQVTREEIEKTLTRTDVTGRERQALSVTLDNYETLGRLDSWRSAIGKEDVAALSRMIDSAREHAFLHKEARAYTLAHFQEIDTNKDGRVGAQEWIAARAAARGDGRRYLDYLDRNSERIGAGGGGSSFFNPEIFRSEQLARSKTVDFIDPVLKESYRPSPLLPFSIAGGLAGGALGLYMSWRKGGEPTVADGRLTLSLVTMGASAGAGIGRMFGPTYEGNRDSIHRLVQEFGGLKYTD